MFFHRYSKDINYEWMENIIYLIKNEKLAYKRIYIPINLYSELESYFITYNPLAIIVIYLHFSQINMLKQCKENIFR